MSSVLKETFIDCNVKATENFGTVQEAHDSNRPSDKALVEVLETKITSSRIKLNKATKDADVRPKESTDAKSENREESSNEK